MQEVKIEVQTIKIESEKNVIPLSSAQVEEIVKGYVMRKKKLPDDAEFIREEDGGYRIEWKKENKKTKSVIAGEKKTGNNTPNSGVNNGGSKIGTAPHHHTGAPV